MRLRLLKLGSLVARVLILLDHFSPAVQLSLLPILFQQRAQTALAKGVDCKWRGDRLQLLLYRCRQLKQVHDLSYASARNSFFRCDIRLFESRIGCELLAPLECQLVGMEVFWFLDVLDGRSNHGIGGHVDWKQKGMYDVWLSTPAGERHSENKIDVPKSSCFAPTCGATLRDLSNLAQSQSGRPHPAPISQGIPSLSGVCTGGLPSSRRGGSAPKTCPSATKTPNKSEVENSSVSRSSRPNYSTTFRIGQNAFAPQEVGVSLDRSCAAGYYPRTLWLRSDLSTA